MLSASPKKLRSGAWGALVQGSPARGDEVRVTTRAGKSWTALVARVIWSGDGVAICATESLDRPARRRSSRYPWRPCGYPGCRPDYCDECDGEGYRPGH